MDAMCCLLAYNLSFFTPLFRYMEMDINLYDKCSRDTSEKLRTKEVERNAATTKWATLEAAASARGVVVSK